MLAEELRQLGFGDRKAALYLAVLARGRGTAAELATAAKIRRTTAYGLLEELTAERLVSVTFIENKRYFVAEPPETLRQRVADQVAAADRLMPGLKELFGRTDSRPRVRYFEGVEGLRYVHEELLKVKSREYFYFGSMAGFVDALGIVYMEAFVRRRISRRIWSHAIRIRSQEVDSPLLVPGDENYRKVRYLSRSLPDSMANLTLFDGKIAICSTSHENYAMIIESRETYTILKLVWDCMWEVASE